VDQTAQKVAELLPFRSQASNLKRKAFSDGVLAIFITTMGLEMIPLLSVNST